MDRGDALGVDIAVFEHGVHHEGLDGGRGEVQSEEERHLNAALRYLLPRQLLISTRLSLFCGLFFFLFFFLFSFPSYYHYFMVIIYNVTPRVRYASYSD